MAGLYIHIPFCRSKCIYCDFYSSPKMSEMEQVVAGLVREFDARRSEISDPFGTIYIGGGTPSVLPAHLLKQLVDALPVEDALEFTIEVNPDDVCGANVALWRNLGINRVSMGVQTLSDEILKKIGRRHSSRQALDAIDTLISGGITNLSADLIYGLPGLDNNRWRKDVRTIMTSGITHLSAYCLTYHEGTMLYKLWQKGKVAPADDETVAAQFDILRDEAAAMGFEHYEISNLAKPGFRSRHNSGYWSPSHTWLGIGPSAHSFDGRTRRIDIAPSKAWLEHLPCPVEIDTEDTLDLINDNIVTALRTADGLDLETIPERYRQTLMASADRFINTGEMTYENNRLAIPGRLWLMSDFYIRELIIC